MNLVTEKDSQGRVYLSTYPTLMGLIDDAKDGQKRFSVGHCDLVVIDEAHRSVYQKYRSIFDYFDSLLVGLDREVAKKLFSEFLQGGDYNANQIEFINLIINQLVDHGIVDVSILCESPFTDISPQGPDAIFTSDQIDKIMGLLEDIRSTAIAA